MMARAGSARPPLLAAAAISFLSGAMPAAAATFDVRPVTIEARNGSASFTVSNPGDTRVYIETSVYSWSMDAAGKDVLVEAGDAVSSPPAMWIPPHGSYLVRLVLPKASGNREGNYRVAVQNVPDRMEITAGRVVFSVTQRLPAFSEPDDLAPPDLHASLEGGHLMIVNNGGRRARISGVAQDGKVLAQGLLGYALGGYKLALDVRVHPGRIEVGTDQGMRTLDAR